MMASMSAKRQDIMSETTGQSQQMGVKLREIDPFNCWVGAHAAFELAKHLVPRSDLSFTCHISELSLARIEPWAGCRSTLLLHLKPL